MGSNKERWQLKPAAKQKTARIYAATQPKRLTPEQVPGELERLFDPSKLTVPSVATEDVAKFCRLEVW